MQSETAFVKEIMTAIDKFAATKAPEESQDLHAFSDKLALLLDATVKQGFEPVNVVVVAEMCVLNFLKRQENTE